MPSNYGNRKNVHSVNTEQEPFNRTNRSKPLGESRKAVFRQQLMVFLGNTGVMGAGMAVALPSVTLGQLTDITENFHLSEEKASWFCMLAFANCSKSLI